MLRSKCLLNNDKFGASSAFLVSLIQGLAILSVKICFLIFSLNLPCCPFGQYTYVVSTGTRKQSPAPHSSLQEDERAMALPFNSLHYKVHPNPPLGGTDLSLELNSLMTGHQPAAAPHIIRL